MLKLEVMLAVKPNLSTRSVLFVTKSEAEVYQLENNARIMLYGEHERPKKLKAWAVDVLSPWWSKLMNDRDNVIRKRIDAVDDSIMLALKEAQQSLDNSSRLADLHHMSTIANSLLASN